MDNAKTLKAVVVMMSIMFIGKALGLVREMLFGFHYGTESIEAAAFTVANQIPKNFLDAMFASAISASFIPVFNDYFEKQGKEAAFRLTHNFVNIVLLISGIVCILGIIFASPIVGWYAAGFVPEAKALSAVLLRTMFPLLMISGVAFALVGVVQSLGEFSIPAAMSVVSNAVIIIYFVFFIGRFGVYGLAIAFVLGWLTQLLIQLPFLYKNGLFSGRWRFFIDFKDPGIKQIFVLMLPVMVSTWIQPVNITINTRVASGLFGGGPGVTALNYANTLYTVIMGVFILSVANVIFPRLAKQNTHNDKDGFGDTLYFTLHAIFYFLIPMTVGLIIISEPLVRLVFEIEGGMFNAFSTAITARALAFYCAGIIGFGVYTILSRGFYALKDGRTPLITSIAAITINLILSLLLVGPMDVGGVALASSVSISVVAVVMIVVMSKNFKLNGAAAAGSGRRSLWRDIALMTAAAGVCAVCAIAARDFFLQRPDTT
ncbi:MAG: murein biosynthesis integral membrane protein MurJ, partial [Defluviitaleaceae bacterium]|nr:murein biosynthesis integral membrane protein MurJ [Defluviitaleaceae bacterium]